jgi:hypothetical protein
LLKSPPPKRSRPQLGLRPQQVPPTRQLSGMPTALQADINLGAAHHLSTDRGAVRAASARTAQSRGGNFTDYLVARGVDEHNIHLALAESQVLGVLKGYLLQVAQGLNCLQKADLDDQTLRGYLNAAAREITRLTGRPCSILDPATLHYKRPQMHPYLRDTIQQRAAWKEPKQGKAPVTLPMIAVIQTMAHELVSSTGLMAAFLSVEYAVYNWKRVVIYTGLRIAE